MMSPAALSTLTTTFTSRRDRNPALGAWAAVPGLAGATGVVLSGVLTEGPGWRWIFYLNVPVAIARRPRRARAPRRRTSPRGIAASTSQGLCSSLPGCCLHLRARPRSGGRLGPTADDQRLAAAVALLAAFVANERRARNPLVPFSIFRIKGLAAANVTQLHHVQRPLLDVLLPQPLHAARARATRRATPALRTYRSPGVHALGRDRDAARAAPRPRPVIICGALVAAGGLCFLCTFQSRAPSWSTCCRASSWSRSARVQSSPASPLLLPTASRRTRRIASGLLNASMQFGGAFGLAVLSAVATARTGAVLDSGADLPAGPHRRLPAGLPDRRGVRARRGARRLPGRATLASRAADCDHRRSGPRPPHRELSSE